MKIFTLKTLTIVLSFFVQLNQSFAQTEDQKMLEVYALSNEGKLKKAIKICDEIIQQNPNYTLSYINKSFLYRQLGEYEEALLALDEGLQENTKSANLYHERGIIYQSFSAEEMALRDYTLGIKFAENDSVINSIKITRSTLSMQTREFDKAYATLLECYAFDSTNKATLNNLATVCDEVGRADETLGYLLKVIEIDSAFIPGYVNIGFMYQTQKEYEKSIPYFDKALELNPTEAFSFNNRAYSKLMMGNLVGALKDVNRSLELYPGNAYAYRNRALIYIEKNKMKKACEDLQLAITWGFTDMYGNEVDKLIRKHCQ
ncbi:MAG: tetratricopeptide (TPR) repeat protein [Crocinitomix sp.]|jgi:tetratricopeptide (TPR) repeat protein